MASETHNVAVIMSQRFREAWFLTSELEGERASSFRQERWCGVFLDAGIRLRIFNLRGAFRYSDVQCATPDNLAEFRRRGVGEHRRPQASVREGFAALVLRRIKHLLLIDLYLPNVIMTLLHAHRLLRQRQEPVVLMASSPPFSVAIIGAILKRLHGAKVLLTIDMRDAWALHRALGGVGWLKRAIERVVLRCADSVVTVSQGLALEFERTYGVEVEVMYNVATHYLDVERAGPADWTRISSEIRTDRLQLVYTGSTPEGFYDLKSVVGSMVQLREIRADLADRLQLVFVGACDEVRREAAGQRAAPDDIVFIGHLPHASARSVQVAAHALLFLGYLGEDNGGVVSTKLFEYLCLEQPILPLSVHRDSDVDQLLRRYCGNSINAHSVEEMMHQLAQVARDGTGSLPRLPDRERVRELLEDYRDYVRRLLKYEGRESRL